MTSSQSVSKTYVGHQILVIAPTGRDAEMLATVLKNAGVTALLASGIEELTTRRVLEASAILLVEEALTGASIQSFRAVILNQPEWSDIPLLILGGQSYPGGQKMDELMDLFEDRGNVILLARPIRVRSFLAGIRIALSTRQRQFQVRDYMKTLTDTQARLEASLNEKAVLVREVHHRVKNNLQVISGLLQISQNSDHSFKTPKDVLLESQRRVTAMAMVHEQLHQSEDLTSIDFSSYISSLAEQLVSSSQDALGQIILSCDIESIQLAMDQAIPCGLILNELICNSLKHAFPRNRAGTIWVSATQEGRQPMIIFSVKDDGVGVPRNTNSHAIPTTGMLIVRILAKQLMGELVEPTDGGSTFRLTFPKHREPARAG